MLLDWVVHIKYTFREMLEPPRVFPAILAVKVFEDKTPTPLTLARYYITIFFLFSPIWAIDKLEYGRYNT